MKRRTFITQVGLVSGAFSFGVNSSYGKQKTIVEIAELKHSKFQNLIGKEFKLGLDETEVSIHLKDVFVGKENSFKTPFILSFEAKDCLIHEGIYLVTFPDGRQMEVYLEQKRFQGGVERIEAVFN
ncbi:DUF6916 family protein [Jiulongibacter sediminis]|uniref:DUF6916 domain-containing protein n=1 Tax=Jiulongibacter sediminis TaxID=1605367 RepID=A0A0P7BDL4_9BACT|nr:hypothetical protein [Jiulongibacter sediminis]KPM48823.1 hypothetical protein AFM12_09620 [Jiulongibacter sediminis]TBX25354.1 hypothetical protein TK44_09625 [Jiulongibacter sediminis]